MKIPELKLDLKTINDNLGLYLDICGTIDYNACPDLDREYISYSVKQDSSYKDFETEKQAREYLQDKINELSIFFLKEFDKQGLLTKEASLSLKPDNWIGWTSYKEAEINVTGIIYQGTTKQTNLEIAIWKDNTGYKLWIDDIILVKTLYKSLFDDLLEAKQGGQKWLDEKLKEGHNA